ncbi:hypothetical protein [Planctomycetes bacterium SV_7m_r]|uniref:hypothetical protein n=1 Tax=Stieleria bergensis TaxID=2528025 RepID=UPI0011A9525E
MQNPYSEKESLRELALLYEAVAEGMEGYDAKLGISVHTRNPYAFRLMTGMTAPMRIEMLGIDPKYTHAVLNTAAGFEPPTGSEVLEKVNPWIFVRLAEPTTATKIGPLQ